MILEALRKVFPTDFLCVKLDSGLDVLLFFIVQDWKKSLHLGGLEV